MSGYEHIIGIDLGTTNSVVAIIENGEPHIIMSPEGQNRVPSVVCFQPDGNIVIGEIARRQASTQPEHTVSSIKRLIGRLKQEIDDAGEVYPFEISEDEMGMATIVVDGQAYLPEQLSALILQKLKQAAEDYLGEEVKKAVITVPAYFDDLQRQATKRAAEIAGLEVMRLINEPTAAAMAYGLNRETQETVAIYDFGGGTFDFSLLDIDNKAFEVLTSTGNSRLGGDDLDMALVDHIADKFMQVHNFDLRGDSVTLRRLKDECERAKCELSSASTSIIRLPFIAQTETEAIHLEEVVRRETLEDLIEPLIHETLQWCRQGLKEANLKKGQVTKVILVGGSTRIPLVQELVEDFFGIAPFRGVNPDEVVSIGAAMQGAVLSGELEEVVLLDVTPHTLGIEVKGNKRSVIIQKNSTIPIKAYKTFSTTEENQSFVNIHLLQGEEERASECRSLGKFTLSGIPPSKPGMPRIRVEIFVNADGVVEVSASETGSGSEQKLVTSCTYLNADERRGQHRSTVSGRKRRRRAASASAESAKDRRAATPLVGRKADSTGAKMINPVETERVELTSSFAEIEPVAAKSSAPITDDDLSEVVAAPRPVVRAGRPPAAAAPAGSSKPIVTAKSGETPPKPVPIPEPAASAEPVEASGASGAESKPKGPVVSRTENTTKSDTAVSDQHAGVPSIRFPLKIEIPSALKNVHQLLMENRFDLEATETYESTRDAFLEFCQKYETDPAIQSLKVIFLVYTKRPEEARDVLGRMEQVFPDAKSELFDLYTLLTTNFPNFAVARRERAQLALAIGNYQTAMADLEFVAKRGEESAPGIFDELGRVYERIVSDSNDATVQFKLVKLHLRRGDLDEAISLLQQLVQVPEHRNRANKVMGFCFWQKGLRYLAWQKFKLVPLDDEMKDNLYRLSVDMETNDELVHAQHVLERIYGADIAYRDCGERLKKINYRIQLMQDDRYQKNETPSEGGGGNKVMGDRFEIIEELNRGSMGIVFKARDRVLDEIVAIKVLNDFLCADPQSVKRFISECKSARRLTHPNIVRIHDFYDLDKKIISMEYIEGEDMRTILARNMTFNEDLVRFYLRQICVGLSYAHKLGIVHRDIKPANIMIDERNQVKITDFGIAKMLDAQSTNTGTMIVGTPLYMAPEQIDGRPVDQRADIYALGIMLYELVTGAPPFHEGNIEYQHLHKPVPEITAAISPVLRRVIMHSVEKDPTVRYQSIDEVLADLELPPDSESQAIS